MDKITRGLAVILFGSSSFCIGAGYKLEAIYLILSAIYMLLIDKNNGKN